MAVATQMVTISTLNQTLPHGWRQCIANDGRIYYQNDSTRQTQWTIPRGQPIATVQQIVYSQSQSPAAVQPRIGSQTQILGATQTTPHHLNEDEDGNTIVVKWWNKSHFIWLVMFVLNIYDFVTDIKVSLSWFTMSNGVCPQFGCYVVTHQLLRQMAYILLICSCVGFIFAFVMKLYEGYGLYIFYTYPINQNEKNVKDLQDAKMGLCIGWFPLVFEDVISLILIFYAYSRGNVINIKDISGLHLQSMIISLCSVTGSVLWSFRKRFKLKKTGDPKYTNAFMLHCLWCTVTVLVVVFIAIFVVVFVTSTGNEPIVGIKNIYNINEAQVYCTPNGSTYNAFDADVNHTYHGNLINEPDLIYDGCYGYNYEYKVKCVDDIKHDTVKLLHCTLNWFNFKIADTSNIRNISMYDKCDVDEQCEFAIELGVCQNYTISCSNNFQFYDGDAVMWACFDYCQI